MGIVVKTRFRNTVVPLALSDMTSGSTTFAPAGSVVLDMAIVRENGTTMTFTWRGIVRLDAALGGLSGEARLYDATNGVVLDLFSITSSTPTFFARTVNLPASGVFCLQAQVRRSSGITGNAVLACCSIETLREVPA